jgi:sulfur carrier protein
VILSDGARVAKAAAARENDGMISVTINGERRQFDAPLNCAELIDRLELAGKRVALEKNGEIVPRSRHAQERLADGDRLEIVAAVGGG